MKPIAHITYEIIMLLNLSCRTNTEIYIGQTNIAHMEDTHPQDYHRYHPYIGLILRSPDFVGRDPRDHSIEYVRKFDIYESEYVKIAVRPNSAGKYFARTLYTLTNDQVNSYIQKGTLKRLTI